MKYPPSPLPPGRAAELLGACGSGRAGIRNRALIAILWRAGLRCNEAAGLRLEDLEELEGGAMRMVVRDQKGGGSRVVGLDERAAELVRRWLEERGKVAAPWLFVTRTAHRLQTSYFRQLVPRLARRAGMDQRVHPHGLRHTFARELYEEGVGIRDIQELLGHRSLATTDRYLRSIGASKAVEVATRREWK